MKKLRLAALALLVLAAGLAHATITLTPLPGSTPQTTHPNFNLANPIGVTANDELGAPVQGLPVTFQIPLGFFGSGANAGSNFVTVATDASGVAVLPPPGLTAANVPGTLSWPAVAPGATSALFTVTVAGAFEQVILPFSGDNQVTRPGTVFAEHFVVRVTDSAGNPTPNALITFNAGSPGAPSGDFSGASVVSVTADESGFATSPPFTANSVVGFGAVTVTGTIPPPIPTAPLSFNFRIDPAASPPIVLTPLPGSTPQTARPFTQFVNPIGVTATKADGTPAAFLPILFQFRSPFQGTGFNTMITITADANGIATLPAPGLTYLSSIDGEFLWTATATNAIDALFDLTIAGQPPVRIVPVSTPDGQVVPPGTVLPPMTVRVLDVNDAPVPNVVVTFYSPGVGRPSVTYNGASLYSALTDANGLATSTPIAANNFVGVAAIGARVQFFLNLPMSLSIQPPPPLTLTPVAGSTPQTTCPYCYFPNPIGVTVRNADGTPAPGRPVTFASNDTFATVPDLGNVFTVSTGPDGIAWASSPVSPSGYVANAPGTMQVVASTPNGTSTPAFDLTVAGIGPTRIQLLSGDGQVARAGGEIAPWVARAFDENANPVPNAAVTFYVNSDASFPGATFEGGMSQYMKPADSNGIATSPRLTANATAGESFGYINLLADVRDQGSPTVNPDFTIVTGNPGFGSLRSWIVPPASIAVGATSAIPYSVKVLNASGQGVANAPVTFTSDRSCATFAGSRTVTVNADTQGIATSPPLTGTHPKVSCATSAVAAGKVLDLTTHVFDPSKVSLATVPAIVHSQASSGFSFEVTVTEHNAPVAVTDFAVRMLALPNGATALTTPLFGMGQGYADIGIQPNEKTGVYAIEITTAGQRLVVPVVQGP